MMFTPQNHWLILGANERVLSEEGKKLTGMDTFQFSLTEPIEQLPGEGWEDGALVPG